MTEYQKRLILEKMLLAEAKIASVESMGEIDYPYVAGALSVTAAHWRIKAEKLQTENQILRQELDTIIEGV